MLRKILLICMVTALLFITACDNQESEVDTSGVFIGGTLGVVANFEAFGVEEDGAFAVFDTETFPIELTLHNKGEHELQAGDVTVNLLGPAKEEFEGISSSLPKTPLP